jgi:hypothetical protein
MEFERLGECRPITLVGELRVVDDQDVIDSGGRERGGDASGRAIEQDDGPLGAGTFGPLRQQGRLARARARPQDDVIGR